MATIPFTGRATAGQLHESRVPPQNIEAEQGVLGSVLFDNARLAPVRAVIGGPEEFYRDAHGLIWSAVCDLHDAHGSVDCVTLAEELTRRDQFRAVGAEDYLAEVMAAAPHAENAVQYAQIVHQKAITRQILDAVNLTAEDCYSNAYTAEQIVHLARVRITRIESVTRSSDDEPDLDRIPRAAPFPLDCLTEGLALFCEESAASIPCPVDYLALPCLAIAGAAIGRSIAVRIKDSWSEMANTWAVIVGGPGTAKSPALAIAERPIWRIADRLAIDYEFSKREVAEERKRLREEAKKSKKHHSEEFDPPAPTYRRINAIDATPESLAPVLAENPRGLIFVHDELSGLINGMNQYRSGGGNELQFYLKLWNRSSIVVDRKSNENRVPTVVREPFVAIAGAMTPDMLDMLPTTEKGRRRNDGFLDRFLFAYPDKIKRRWVSQAPSETLTSAWSDAVLRLWGLPVIPDDSRAGRPFWLDMRPDARARFAAWYDERCLETEEPDFPSDLEGPWAKSFAYCARLAIVLHLLDWAYDPVSSEIPPPLPVHAVERAIRLMTYFDVHYRRVLAHIQGGDGGTPESRDGFDLIQWAIGRGKPRFTAAEVRDNFRRRFGEKPELLTAALGWLISRNAVTKLSADHRPRAGRPPSDTFEIHPSLLRGAREIRKTTQVESPQ